MYGKTIAFGMAFITMNLDHKKDSGGNSRTHLNLTKNSILSWSHQKSSDSTHEHLFEFLVKDALQVGH